MSLRVIVMAPSKNSSTKLSSLEDLVTENTTVLIGKKFS